ncbi:uncharacterized protein SPAPADRAFT_63601 [Spathaspora passalidarum NRRL Y-27907]|uniref:RRM domain-containing protein n=1 Tax=Spathaspora passalidarum (strain NRRL Y-27907 / 11-Y1) TaxID=619300 RepID=G3AVT0_SPAPN|nr:uncharacterized protein SPAPADRAFT_63601 [Spathaspora passalidarum NRRL Y-27907]EGW29975.1 hypothetical protein SPAPADRAFT_63601 [Spathaspora passalidarum NRRL Y-27907]
MAKSVKKTQSKKAAPKKETVEKSVEQIEEDLQLPSSSDEEEQAADEEEEEEPLSSEDDDDDDDEDLHGLSSDDEDEEEQEEQEEQKEQQQPEEKSKSRHTVNKSVESSSAAKSNKKKKSKRGIMYIGRLPSGFQEQELTKYFTQFGDIINLKLSRNKKTGKSKHYGFIEFESYEVAKVAAETMNNYLLFGHLLKCQVLENNDEIHQDLFKDANKKFKVIPWGKISKHKHDKPKTKEQWEVLVKKFEQSKKNKQNELKSKGIDFDLNNI